MRALISGRERDRCVPSVDWLRPPRSVGCDNYADLRLRVTAVRRVQSISARRTQTLTECSMCSGVLATRLNCAPRLGISSSEHLIDFEVGSRKEGSEKFSSRMLLLLYAVSVYYLFPVTLL